LEKVDKRFRLEFEFESFSNSNFTQIKSRKKPGKNPTQMFYHILNIYLYKWFKKVEHLGEG
jgi:hypothetical protein